MTAGIGHNGGPTMERGQMWRTHLWKRARQKAMPATMPLMVVRMHVARAHELGLDYPTYAAVRKASGRDIMGLLFSSNALGVVKPAALAMPRDSAARLAGVTRARRLALVHAPLDPGAVMAANPALDAADRAPLFTHGWARMRADLGRFIAAQDLVHDQVLVIGDTAAERDWSAAARAAGYIEAPRYFRP